MLSILIANSKGGSGKSTIATNLSGALARAGHTVLLADADRQRSCLAWSARRPATAQPVAVVDWVKSIGDVPHGVTRVVIDGPAGVRKSDVEALIAAADLVVMPVLPSSFDQEASRSFIAKLEDLKPIRKNRKGLAIVGNRVRARTKSAARLDRFLAGIGHTVVARLRDSQGYGEAAERGLTIFDVGNARARTLQREWEPLIDYIEQGIL